MYAVIRTGGKQYRVAPEDVLDIEKIPGEAGEIVEFADVLMIAGEGEPQIGAPLVSGATVAAELVEHHRGEKIIIFKKRRRQNYRRKRGHRQDLTTVRITEILTGGAKPSKTAAKAETAEAPAKKPKAAKAEASADPKPAKAEGAKAKAAADDKPAKAPAKKSAKKES
jgi:large subunit ribosomal protein L21